jgi:hypothetical protein
VLVNRSTSVLMSRPTKGGNFPMDTPRDYPEVTPSNPDPPMQPTLVPSADPPIAPIDVNAGRPRSRKKEIRWGLGGFLNWGRLKAAFQFRRDVIVEESDD